MMIMSQQSELKNKILDPTVCESHFISELIEIAVVAHPSTTTSDLHNNQKENKYQILIRFFLPGNIVKTACSSN